MTGIEMMLKGAGIDIPKLVSDFKTLQDVVIQTLQRIDARLQHLEAMTEDLWKAQQPYKPMPQAQPPAEQPPAQQPQNSKPVLQLVPQNQQPQKQPAQAQPQTQ